MHMFRVRFTPGKDYHSVPTYSHRLVEQLVWKGAYIMGKNGPWYDTYGKKWSLVWYIPGININSRKGKALALIVIAREKKSSCHTSCHPSCHPAHFRVRKSATKAHQQKRAPKLRATPNEQKKNKTREDFCLESWFFLLWIIIMTKTTRHMTRFFLAFP